MSRSKKRIPIVKDHNSGKYGKQQANRAVRREKNILFSGTEYKKVFNSWDIHDYISYYSKEDAIKDWYEEEIWPAWQQYRHQRYHTLENWIKAWEKENLNK